MRRRDVLRGGGALAAALVLPDLSDVPSLDVSAEGPFRHGVASGDPLPDGVILWTRVTVAKAGNAGVSWVLARDEALQDVVADGRAVATAFSDFTIRVDVRDLEPATTYWYGFESLGRRSPVGRTRTAPAPRAGDDHMRIGLVSCASYQAGRFNAYERLAERDVDLVVHLGDYVYDLADGESPGGGIPGRPLVPAHRPRSLADYRARHALQRSDPQLQRLHAAHPVVAIWDDHDIAGNAWRDGASAHDEDEDGAWAARRAAGLRAWMEWVPIRPPGGKDAPERGYRSLSLGRLADLVVLDTRLAGRDEQVRRDDPDPGAAVADPARELLGPEQRAWLFEELRGSSARWRLLANQVMLSPLPVKVPKALESLGGRFALPIGGRLVNADQWDGYEAERERVLGLVRDEGIDNLVVLTGDLHSSWAVELPGSAGVELVTPSVTAESFATLLGIGDTLAGIAVDVLLASNPGVQYADIQRHGYVVLDVTPERVQADWWHVDTIESVSDSEGWSTGWQVVSGDPRLRAAKEPVSDEPAAAPPSIQPPAPSPGGRDLVRWVAGGGAAAAAAVGAVLLGVRRRRHS